MRAAGPTVAGLLARSALPCGCKPEFHTWGVIKGELVMLLSISFLFDGNLAHEMMPCGTMYVHVCVSVCLVALEAISQIQSYLTARL